MRMCTACNVLLVNGVDDAPLSVSLRHPVEAGAPRNCSLTVFMAPAKITITNIQVGETIPELVRQQTDSNL